MVRLHVKRGGESQFLLEAPGSTRLAELAPLAARIHNGRLKVQRLCSGTAWGRGGWVGFGYRFTGPRWRRRGSVPGFGEGTAQRLKLPLRVPA